jgi:hypothetical protein
MLERKIAEAEIQPRSSEYKHVPILSDWRSLAMIAAISTIAIITTIGYSSNFTLETPNGYRGSWQLERPSR